MGISNLSTGLRPGVCTSTTRPSTPFEGQMIYETDTNRVLVYEGAAWVMIADTDSPPGMELVKVQTVGTSVASVEVTGAFSSGFDIYRITYTGGSNSAQGDIGMTLGSTNTGYSHNIIYTAWSNTPSTAAAGATASSSWSRAGIAETDSNYLNLDIANPFLAKRTIIWGSFVGSDSTRVGGTVSGFLANTTSYTAFTLTPSSGTMTGGTIRVYGYRNTI